MKLFPRAWKHFRMMMQAQVFPSKSIYVFVFVENDRDRWFLFCSAKHRIQYCISNDEHSVRSIYVQCKAFSVANKDGSRIGISHYIIHNITHTWAVFFTSTVCVGEMCGQNAHNSQAHSADHIRVVCEYVSVYAKISSQRFQHNMYGVVYVSRQRTMSRRWRRWWWWWRRSWWPNTMAYRLICSDITLGYGYIEMERILVFLCTHKQHNTTHMTMTVRITRCTNICQLQTYTMIVCIHTQTHTHDPSHTHAQDRHHTNTLQQHSVHIHPRCGRKKKHHLLHILPHTRALCWTDCGCVWFAIDWHHLQN